MSEKDPPHLNVRKALKKIGPVQVNVNMAQVALRASHGPADADVPDPALAAECSGVIADIVAVKERLIRLYERMGGTWER